MNHPPADAWTEAAYGVVEYAEAHGLSEREAAERFRVSQPTYHRWKKAKDQGVPLPEPRGEPRIALLRFINRESGNGTAVEEVEPSQDEQTAEDTLRYFEGTIRQMGGAGNIDAGELKLRRLDALEGLRRFFSARGAVPGWWYRLKDKVDNDEF